MPIPGPLPLGMPMTDPQSTSGLRRPNTTVAAGLVIAAAVGLMVTRLGQTGSLVVLLVLAAGIAALVIRLALTARSPRDSLFEPVADEQLDQMARALRVPRFFYYLGILFLGQLTFRLPLGFTLSDWCFFVSLVLASVIMLSSRRRPERTFPNNALWAGVILFSAGGLLSSLAAQNPSASLTILARFVYVTLVWFALGAVVLVRREHLHRALWLWVISIAATGAAAVAQLFFGNVIPGTAITFGRMTGFTQHVNDLGGMTSIALAPAIALTIRRSSSSTARLFAAACAVLISSGLILSGSVGGMLAAAVAVFLFVSSGRSAGRLLLFSAVVAVVLLVILGPGAAKNAITPVTRVSQATGGAESQYNTLQLRLDDYREAWRRIQANPLIGVGLGPENGVVRGGLQVHNMILGPWFEAGALAAVGMVVLLLAMCAVARHATQLADNPDDWRSSLAVGAAFVAFLSFGLGAPVLFQRYGWISAAVLVAIRAQQQRSAASRYRSSWGPSSGAAVLS